ncbi:Ostc [Columba guinea]|nr:Ostc [Columba guinea]
MEALYRLPFAVLECPNIKLKRPSWVHMPSAMTVYALVVVSYFLITGGIIYDVIVEPPSVGSMTDEHGHQRPVAFLAYRVNGQYIMEGLASSFLFTMGGLGFIILDRSNAPNIPKLNRFLLLFIGFVSVLLSFFMARVFMRMKLPQAETISEPLAIPDSSWTTGRSAKYRCYSSKVTDEMWIPQRQPGAHGLECVTTFSLCDQVFMPMAQLP